MQFPEYIRDKRSVDEVPYRFPQNILIRPWGFLARLKASFVHWRDPLVREKAMTVRINGSLVMPTEPPRMTNVEKMVLDFLMACVATAEEAELPKGMLSEHLVAPMEGEVAL